MKVMNAIRAAVEKAEGFLSLGMGVEAWETLEDLPTESKNHPEVLALRVAVLVHEKSWQKAVFLADGVLTAFPALAGVWLDLARAKAQLGDLEAAKEALRRAFALDGELKLEAVRDERFSALW
jgi:tetratricopeptide (TPR) repeat protein